MLIIQPSGGLCNRMRVINSAQVLGKKLGRKVLVLWYVSPELNARFEDLFLPCEDLSIINITSLKDPRKLFYQLTAKQRFGNDDILNNKTDGVLHDDFVSALKDPAYIFTWEHFFPSSDYHYYKPTKVLQDRIDSYTKDFGEHCVGVHIRRTDNLVSMGKSTTEQFVALMEKAIAEDPETKFFLATDDAAEEALMREKFPDRILSNQTRNTSRDSLEGMYDALLDLFCLSSTKRIIGSYWSSFTDIAADMGGISKVIAGDE